MDSLHEGDDVLDTDLGVLIVVHVPQGVGSGGLPCGLADGVVAPDLGVGSAIQNAGQGIQVGDGGGGGVIPAVHPVDDLVDDALVALCAEGDGSLLQLDELGAQAVELSLGVGAGGQLGLQGAQSVLDGDGLLQVDDAVGHVLVDHVLGQFLESLGSVVGDHALVVDAGEGSLPGGISLGTGLPDVPGVAGVAEDGDLAGLGLLHGVQDDTLDLGGIDAGMQEVGVAAHDQVVLGVVGAGPVDPQVGAAADVVIEGVGEAGAAVAPDLTAGHDDLDVLGEVAVVGLAVAHVLLGDEGQQELQIGVGLLHFLQPLGHVGQHAGVVGAALVAGIVGQDGDLTDTGLDDLRELGLQDVHAGVIVGVGDGVVHVGVQSVDEAALGSVAGLGQRTDQGLDLFLGVQLTPVGVVLGVILGGVEVGVQLVVAAPGHQGCAILNGPGVAVVALDEATGGNVSVVVDGQVAQILAGQLAEDLVQGGQAVEGGVGVLTQDHDLAVAGGHEVGVGLVEQSGVHGVVGVDVGLGDIAGAVDTDVDVGLVGIGSLRLGDGQAEQSGGLLQTGLGVIIDALVIDGIDVLQLKGAFGVGHGVGGGVEGVLYFGFLCGSGHRHVAADHCQTQEDGDQFLSEVSHVVSPLD